MAWKYLLGWVSTWLCCRNCSAYMQRTSYQSRPTNYEASTVRSGLHATYVKTSRQRPAIKLCQGLSWMALVHVGHTEVQTG